MGNRAIIQVSHDRNPLAERIQLYVHWFNHNQFHKILNRAIRSGVRADCLASAIVSEYFREDRYASRNRPESFTTIRIESSNVVHGDLDVPPITVHASHDKTTVTFASAPENPHEYGACRP